MKKNRVMMLSAAVCAGVMLLVDGVVKPPYLVKSLVKAALFGGCVLGFCALYRETLSLFRPSRVRFWPTLLLSAGVYGLILAAYRLTALFIDYTRIAGTLTATIGVGRDNFLFVSMYISFVNSLLEEIFFRGYCYLTLRECLDRRRSTLFSAGLFAVYHAGMLDGWFSPGAYLLMLGLLFLAGLFLNALADRTGSIWSSWLPHMFANFGINTVGFMLFGIL